MVFVTLVIADASGCSPTRTRVWWSSSPLPAVFVMGLLLIPAGMWLQSREARATSPATADWPVIDLRQRHVRRTVLVITGLTAINVVIILLAGCGSLRIAMETPGFCGQVCHTTMEPPVQSLGRWPSMPAWRV